MGSEKKDPTYAFQYCKDFHLCSRTSPLPLLTRLHSSNLLWRVVGEPRADLSRGIRGSPVAQAEIFASTGNLLSTLLHIGRLQLPSSLVNGYTGWDDRRSKSNNIWRAESSTTLPYSFCPLMPFLHSSRLHVHIVCNDALLVHLKNRFGALGGGKVSENRMSA